MTPSARPAPAVAPATICAGDAAGENPYLSHSWYVFSGKVPGSGAGWLDAIHPEDRARLLDFSVLHAKLVIAPAWRR